jgi:hypothetical protein
MKKLASLLFVLALTLGFATSSFAQAVKTPTTLETTFAPYVVGAITTAPGAAGQNYVVGVGIEHDGSRLYLDGSGVYSSALVTANPGAGHSGLFTLQGYYKIKGHLLVGGGATAVLNTGDFQTAHFFTTAKAVANPFVGSGLEFGRFRTIASYQIPMRGAGIPDQIKFTVNNELALTRHVRVGVPLVINSYRVGDAFAIGAGHAFPAYRVTVAQVGGELKLVW